MKKKYYVYRINKKTGRKEYKLHKTLDNWVGELARAICWRFSKQGALGLIKWRRESGIGEYYEFGIEEVE